MCNSAMSLREGPPYRREIHGIRLRFVTIITIDAEAENAHLWRWQWVRKVQSNASGGSWYRVLSALWSTECWDWDWRIETVSSQARIGDSKSCWPAAFPEQIWQHLGMGLTSTSKVVASWTLIERVDFEDNSHHGHTSRRSTMQPTST